MKYLKIFEEFSKVNNITQEDIIGCIKNSGSIYATIIRNLPNNDPKEPLTPVSIDEDGLITIEHDGKEYEIELRNVEKVES
jgi:hypothetical protein